jgi:hypothetical protein
MDDLLHLWAVAISLSVVVVGRAKEPCHLRHEAFPVAL